MKTVFRAYNFDLRNGLIWLLNRGFRVDNVIYYSHTGKFCFGWRKPLEPDTKSRLLDVLSEFPFDYEFKETRTA